MTAKPFPKPLTIALLLPAGLFLLAYVVPKELAIGVLLVGPAVAVIAVPVAIFYLAKGGYRGALNIAVTVVGALPLLMVVMVVFTLMFGHFHI